MSFGAAGEVFYLLSQSSLTLGPKDRRCPLLLDCERDESGIFAYATTQPTEFLGVDPPVVVAIQPRPGYREFANGFEDETFVFPAVLASVAMGHVGTWEGTFNNREFDSVVEAIPRALGFGEGVDTRGVRGGIVEFEPVLASKMDGKFGLVITEPAYGRRPRGYQTIVPLIPDSDPMDDYEFALERPSWLRAIYPEADSVLFAVRDILSVYPEHWRRPAVRRWASTSELEGVEAAIRGLFNIDRSTARLKKPSP